MLFLHWWASLGNSEIKKFNVDPPGGGVEHPSAVTQTLLRSLLLVARGHLVFLAAENPDEAADFV